MAERTTAIPMSRSRSARRHSETATATATMLVVDAWFDVMTSPRPRDLLAAVAMALLVELPLAGVCVWLAVSGQSLLERRIALSLRRRQGLRTKR